MLAAVAAIIHLIGHPGVGKRTVAEAISATRPPDADDRIVLVDNHLTSNPVLTVVPRDEAGRVPDEAWVLVSAIREQVVTAIRELAPPSWSFVFTNVLRRTDPVGIPTSVHLEELAEQRGDAYVPVLLSCDPDEQRRRVAAPGRAERGKWTDPDAVAAFVATVDLLVPGGPHRLDLDITHLAPAEAAQVVLDHVAATSPPTR